MLFYDSIGPNPRAVRMFAAERGITLERVKVDLRGGENRKKPYLEKNPAGQLPCLEFPDGFALAEITAICEYLDETSPGPSLIGSTPRERAEARMWARRIDLNILEPLTNGYRYGEGNEFFKTRVYTIPHASADLKAIAQEKLAWLDELMQGQTFVCGERLTLGDIMLYCFLDFAAKVGQPINPGYTWVTAHHALMGARESAKA